jgi:cell filamentation protein
MADRAGHSVDFDKLEPEDMLVAMIASFGGDERQLAAIIERLVS